MNRSRFMHVLVIWLLVSYGSASHAGAPAVEIRFTEYGIAHIKAGNFVGAGYGYGWVLARDNLCAVVERAVTLAGERSRVLPAEAEYLDAFAGGAVRNVDSDAVYQYLFPAGDLRRLRGAASGDLRDLVRGFARGFNQYVAEPARAGESCRQSAWFRPLTEDDIWRRIAHVPLLETTASVLREIIAARPPGAAVVAAAPTDSLQRLAAGVALRGASNAVAFGRRGVEGAVGGLSFSNPHYAWQGTERLHAFHMTVPGKINVFGAAPYGLPFAMLGFNDSMGWSITHTTDKRSTLYELRLVPGDPTRYFIGERAEAMRAVSVTVQTAAGPVVRRIWETRYGPIVVGEHLEWSATRAYAFADPERGNIRFADQFLAISRATSVRQVEGELRRYLGAPWSNVTAADAKGEALYANITVAGHVTDAQLARCVVDSPARRYMDLADVTVLNGSDPGCAWTVDRRASQAGVIPASLRPAIIRDDVTFNSNDSHWYSSLEPQSRLEGYQQVIGPERSTRGERTRVAALYSQQVMRGSELTGTAGASPPKWERLFFSSRNLTAELILDDLIEDCRRNAVVAVEGVQFDLSAACSALAAWDRRDTLESRGSALFAEFLRGLEAVPMTGFALAPRYWKVAFDPADPVATPRGFKPSEETREALAKAAYRLMTLKVALDAPLGTVQAVTRNGQRLPMSGSMYTYHMVRPGAVAPGEGITDIRTGDSYIHAVSLQPGKVEGRFIVAYSQSTNAASAHFADMTALFSAQTFADVRFSEAQIRAHQVGETLTFGDRAAR